MQLSHETTAGRFLHGFWGVRQAFLRRVAPALREAHGLEVPEVFLMQYISKSDLSPSEIAQSLRIPPHMVSRKVGALEKRGLISRSLDAGDARRRVLSLTPAGEALLPEALGTLHAQVEALLGVLEPDTLKVMLGAMETISQAAKEPS
jgi:DNA-binding MarR family transcriptional regulator